MHGCPVAIKFGLTRLMDWDPWRRSYRGVSGKDGVTGSDRTRRCDRGDLALVLAALAFALCFRVWRLLSPRRKR